MTMRLLPVFVLLLAAGGAVCEAADAIPIPADVIRLTEPTQVVLGSQTIDVRRFLTLLTPEELRVFYRDALPRQRWALQEVPGMEGALQAMKTLHERAPRDTTLERDVSSTLEAAKASRLYARRGREHLLLSFTPGRTQTLVLVNQWTSATDAPSDSPFATLCCEGEPVPLSRRQFSPSLPVYPGARLMTTGTAPIEGDGTGSRSELYATDDAAEEVATYYRQHMAYQGWTVQATPSMTLPEFSASADHLLQQQAGIDLRAIITRPLAFKRDGVYCTVMIVERPQALAAEDTPERTMVLVTYIELSLPRAMAEKAIPGNRPSGGGR